MPRLTPVQIGSRRCLLRSAEDVNAIVCEQGTSEQATVIVCGHPFDVRSNPEQVLESLNEAFPHEAGPLPMAPNAQPEAASAGGADALSARSEFEGELLAHLRDIGTRLTKLEQRQVPQQ